MFTSSSYFVHNNNYYNEIEYVEFWRWNFWSKPYKNFKDFLPKIYWGISDIKTAKAHIGQLLPKFHTASAIERSAGSGQSWSFWIADNIATVEDVVRWSYKFYNSCVECSFLFPLVTNCKDPPRNTEVTVKKIIWQVFCGHRVVVIIVVVVVLHWYMCWQCCSVDRRLVRNTYATPA